MADKKRGRPTKYTKEIADKICLGVSEGKSIHSIAQELNIAPASIFLWLSNNKDFSDNYEKARKVQADLTFESMIELENKVLNGDIHPYNFKVVNDSMKWRLGKMLPKKYGDKQTFEHTVNTDIADELRNRLSKMDE